MLKILKKINVLMDKKQKLSMFKLFLMMVISAALEAGTALLVMNVVQIILKPDDMVKSSKYIAISDLLGINDPKMFSALAIFFLILMYIAKNLFTFFQQKYMYHFIFSNFNVKYIGRN